MVLETKSTTWSLVSLLYIRSILLWLSIRPTPSSQLVALEASSQKSLIPFCMVSGPTQNSALLSSHFKVSDGAGSVVVGDGDVVSVEDPDGVPELLALLDTTLEPSDTTLDVGVGVALPGLLGRVVLSPAVDDEVSLIPISDGETELLATVDSVVGEGPVVGPVIPLLSLTVIEEKLIVRDWKISGGV